MKKRYLIPAIILIAFCSKSKEMELTYDEIKKDIVDNKFYCPQEGISDIRNADYILDQNELNNFISKQNQLYDSCFYVWKENSFEIKTSSCLDANKYKPSNSSDNKIGTVWAENVKGYGFKEWIKFKVKPNYPYEIQYIAIYPGHGGSNSLFKLNNRLKSIVVKTYNSSGKGVNDIIGSPVYLFDRLSFRDEAMYHVFSIGDVYTVGEKNKEQEITVYIENVYRGSKYDDTCIAEIYLMGMIWNK